MAIGRSNHDPASARRSIQSASPHSCAGWETIDADSGGTSNWNPNGSVLIRISPVRDRSSNL